MNGDISLYIFSRAGVPPQKATNSRTRTQGGREMKGDIDVNVLHQELAGELPTSSDDRLASGVDDTLNLGELKGNRLLLCSLLDHNS